MVYYGPPADALGFFGVEHGSFADIYTRLKAEPGDPLYDQLIGSVLQEEYAQWKRENPQQNDPPRLVHLWQARYRKSEQYRRYVQARQEEPTGALAGEPMAQQAAEGTQRTAPRPSFWRQFRIMTQRYIDLMRRDRRNLTILLLQAPIIALFLLLLVAAGALTGTLIPDAIQRLDAQSFLFTLAIVSIWFGVINSASELTKERDIYRRERLSNLTIPPYLLSKVLVLTLLLAIQNAMLLGIVWAGGVGVQLPASTGLLLPAGLEIFITMMLASMGGMVMGLMISASTRNVSQAISLVPLILIPQILFSGIIFTIEANDPVSDTVSRVMVSRWALDAMGTSANVGALCPLPNVRDEQDDEMPVKTQCVVNGEMRANPRLAEFTFIFPLLSIEADDPTFLPFPGAYTYSQFHLLTAWGVLLAFILAGLGVTAWLLKRQDRII